MFVDEVEIKVTAGRGGDGCISFRREKYVPRGGPDGGDGGRGGHVVIKVDSQLNTLAHFRHRKTFPAGNGKPGEAGNRSGADGNDIVIEVPPGTMVFNKRLLEKDLVKDGEEYVIARGGKGGRGNARFATPTNRAPRKSERGLPGEEKEIRLEMRLIAEVGLVGLPNAGKSTLINRISKARPKIASYPFTTLHPVLGVVVFGERTMVWADLPGLIEGAHKGVGLGDRFLRHIERTKVIVHILDGSGLESDPLTSLDIIEEELGRYNKKLLERPQIIVINKIDLAETRANLDGIIEYLHKAHRKYHTISAVTGEGIEELIKMVAEMVDKAPEPEPVKPEYIKTIKPEQAFNILKKNDIFIVEGGETQRVVDKTNFNSDEAVNSLLAYLIKRGLYEALRERGIKEGDTVKIGPMEFEYYE